jgi:capsule polysaccharide modification protein KpsS
MLYPLFQAQLDRCDQQNHQSFHATAKNKCYLVHGLKRNYEKKSSENLSNAMYK